MAVLKNSLFEVDECHVPILEAMVLKKSRKKIANYIDSSPEKASDKKNIFYLVCPKIRQDTRSSSAAIQKIHIKHKLAPIINIATCFSLSIFLLRSIFILIHAPGVPINLLIDIFNLTSLPYNSIQLAYIPIYIKHIHLM